MTRSRLLPLAALFLALPLSAADVAAPAAAPPGWASQITGYATVEQVATLDEGDRADFIGIVHDASWAPRHVDYLRGAQSLNPAGFKQLPKDKQGAVVLEWLRGRAKARAYVKSLAGDTTLTSSSDPTLQTFARAGFLSPLLAKSVLGTGSPVLARLTGASIASGADAQAKLAKLYDNETNSRDLADSDQSIVDDMHLARLGAAPAPVDELARFYQTAHEMVLDPSGFRAARPDVAAASTPEELKAQDNLAAKVGHVYTNIDQLRAQGHFEMVWAPAADMGTAMADTAIVTEPGPNGATTWKIRVQVNDSYKGVDPVLTASTLTHEFLHAYDDTIHLQKEGPAVAQLIPNFQEEEMRAFTAGGNVDSAYGSAIDKVGDTTPDNDGVRSLVESSQELRQLGKISNDPPAYEATLAVLANTELHRRGYVNNADGMDDVATIVKQYQTTEKHLKADQIKALYGSTGLDEAVAKARQQRDYEYMGFLLAAKSADTPNESEVKHQLGLNEGVLKALEAEKARGLALKDDSGLKTTEPPAPSEVSK